MRTEEQIHTNYKIYQMTDLHDLLTDFFGGFRERKKRSFLDSCAYFAFTDTTQEFYLINALQEPKTSVVPFMSSLSAVNIFAITGKTDRTDRRQIYCHLLDNYICNLTSDFASPLSSVKPLHHLHCLPPTLPTSELPQLRLPWLTHQNHCCRAGVGRLQLSRSSLWYRAGRHIQWKLKLTQKSYLLPWEVQGKKSKLYCSLTDPINAILKMLPYLNTDLQSVTRS